jgi:Second Messenger Oligonucleotide or Dinucleotide Synthetase domain
MWMGVRQRFSALHHDLLLTGDQETDGLIKQAGVRAKLQEVYYPGGDMDPAGFMVGSWGKGTQVRPPRDVDAFFVLPFDVYQRFEQRTGNKQSALLQEIKEKLVDKYPQTDMRGDGQVVMVKFNTLMVEIVPAFLTTTNQYLIPDTNDGGSWKLADPWSQILRIDTVDKATLGNTRIFARMMKTWKREQNVPLKSFVVELLVAAFLSTYGNAHHDFFWYDWFVRDFLKYICNLSGGTLTLPGTGEIIPLGNEWVAKANAALTTALAACDMEYNDFTILAGEEWQKIFGNRIPVHVV